jgi:hypothetical protein
LWLSFYFFWKVVAIPTFVCDANVIMALITELALIPMTVHARKIQAHGVRFFVRCQIDFAALPHNRFFPILQ